MKAMDDVLYSSGDHKAFFNSHSIPCCFMKCSSPDTFCCKSFQALQESRRFSVHSTCSSPLRYKRCKTNDQPDWLREARHTENVFPASLCAAAQFSPATNQWLDVMMNPEFHAPLSGTRKQVRAPATRGNQARSQKRDRTVFTPEQLARLESEFHRQQYIMGAERQHVASDLGLTERQVKVWFQNRRIKWRKQCVHRQSNVEMTRNGSY